MAPSTLGKMPEGATPFPPAVIRIFERFERIEPLLAHRPPKHVGMMRLAPLQLSTPAPQQRSSNDEQVCSQPSRRGARSASRRKAPKPAPGSSLSVLSPPSTPPSPELAADHPRAPAAGQKSSPRRPGLPPPWLTPHWDPLECAGFLPKPPLAANLASSVYGAPVVPDVPHSSKRFRRRRRSSSPSGAAQKSAQESSHTRSPSPPVSLQKSAEASPFTRSPSPHGARHRSQRGHKAVKVQRGEAVATASSVSGTGRTATTGRKSPKGSCPARPTSQLLHVVMRGVFGGALQRLSGPVEAPGKVSEAAGSQEQSLPAAQVDAEKSLSYSFKMLPSVGSWLQVLVRRPQLCAALSEPETLTMLEKECMLEEYADDVTSSILAFNLMEEAEVDGYCVSDVDFNDQSDTRSFATV